MTLKRSELPESTIRLVVTRGLSADVITTGKAPKLSVMVTKGRICGLKIL